jgi:hypothetical protein
VLPVFIENCEAPTLFAQLKRCDLGGLSEDDAGVGPSGRTGTSLTIDPEPGFRKMKAHGQASHAQH